MRSRIQMGGAVAVTYQTGTTIERTEYEPYGKVLNLAPVDGPGYTGHALDAVTGMNYMQQRYYDPGIGRFLSVDPVTANSGTGANFNRYWYANNNPYKFTDPDGRLGRGRLGHEMTPGDPRNEAYGGGPSLGGPGNFYNPLFPASRGFSSLSKTNEGDEGESESKPDAGDARQAASWITRIKMFFGIKSSPPVSAAMRAAGTVVNTGISALDTDVHAGVAAVVIDRNVHNCSSSGECSYPEDQITIKGFLREDPPNYRAVGKLFQQRGWEYQSPTDILNRQQDDE